MVGWLAGLHGPGMVAPLRGLARVASWWVLYTLSFGLLLALLVLRRRRHLLVWWVTMQLGSLVTVGLAMFARRPRPFGVDLQASWGGWALPSVPVAFLTATSMGVMYTLVPQGRWRDTGKLVAAGLITVVALARMALGVDAPPMCWSRWASGSRSGCWPSPVHPQRRVPDCLPARPQRPSGRQRAQWRGDPARRQGPARRRGPGARAFGERYSASCTPLRIKVQGDPQATYLFAKLYARSHLRADRWYKLGRELLYGRLEDEKPFNCVRRLVAQEDYALRLLRDAGLPVPKPLGSVELSPEREYLLVTEFLDGAREISEAAIDDTIIDEGLAIVRRLWDAGLAHRDIKPANLLVQDGHLRLIDAFLTEVHSSPWRQAVDLANMLLVLALGTSPQQVYQRALRQFTTDEIAEAFAVRQGGAMPAQLRQLLLTQGADLHDEFVRLLPRLAQPIRIQRWTARRIGLWAAIVALLVLAALNPKAIFTNEDAVATPLEVNDISCSHLEPLWLMAQSVPSATLVPCIRAPLAGWALANVAVNDGRSIITLDHDRAGTGVVVARLTTACDSTGAIEVPAAEPGTRAYKRIEQLTGEYRATWYDRFPGGCVTYRLSSRSDPQGGFAREVSLLFGFTSRQVLRQALHDRSGGRLHLDPGVTTKAV